MAVKNAKCFQLFARLVEKIQWFLSNHRVKSLFIAVSALCHLRVTTINSIIVETFLGFRAWEGFFDVHW